MFFIQHFMQCFIICLVDVFLHVTKNIYSLYRSTIYSLQEVKK